MRSPLIEAALWGRPENTKIFLGNGADTTIKDREGHTAVHFATPHATNSKERSIRGGGFYIEDTYQANKQRKEIVKMLEDKDQNFHCASPAGLRGP